MDALPQRNQVPFGGLRFWKGGRLWVSLGLARVKCGGKGEVRWQVEAGC